MFKICIFLALFLGSALAGTLFNDAFPNKPYNPADPDSPYGYFFFDNTVTAIQNTVSKGLLTQDVDPYTYTVPQGPAGGLDHVKCLQYVKNPAPPGNKKGTVSVSATIGCENFGLDEHPFPAGYVTNANDDLRLGACALNSVDFDTMIVADMFMTNEGVYAFYERLPFARTTTDNYRAYSQTKRVASRVPSQLHDLKIEYDSKQKTLSWFLDGSRVMFVYLIGYPSPDPEVVTMLDHGGDDTNVAPASFRYGFGSFTLLDMQDYHNPNNTSLVRLNDNTGPDYVTPNSFYDDISLEENRLWGQGTIMKVSKFKIENF